MAKASTKPVVKTDKKPVGKKKAATNANQLVARACVDTLDKLQELELDYQLQSEINWCLGSFRNDGNPVGLYLMAQRALVIFKAELVNKRKGITAKLIKDIEKAIQSR